MTDIEPEPIRQCHSYSPRWQRCEHPAGHTGNHYISVEWTDEEAWTPLSQRKGTPDLHTEASVYPTPPSIDIDTDAQAQQIAYAERMWDEQDTLVDKAALRELAALDADAYLITEATPSTLTGPCVACSHMHASGKCKCGCETYIASVAR